MILELPIVVLLLSVAAQPLFEVSEDDQNVLGIYTAVDTDRGCVPAVQYFFRRTQPLSNLLPQHMFSLDDEDDEQGWRDFQRLYIAGQVKSIRVIQISPTEFVYSCRFINDEWHMLGPIPFGFRGERARWLLECPKRSNDAGSWFGRIDNGVGRCDSLEPPVQTEPLNPRNDDDDNDGGLRHQDLGSAIRGPRSGRPQKPMVVAYTSWSLASSAA